MCCCCGRNAGCCGFCCNKGFNEDSFEDEVQKDIAKTRDSNAPAEQPKASPDMTVPNPSNKEETSINEEKVEKQAEDQGPSAVDSLKTDVKSPPS